MNLSQFSCYKVNNYGIYLDNGTIIGAQQNNCNYISVIPQVENNPIIMLDDTLNWMRIEGIFTANGNENRVTIGNFKSDIQTTNLPTNFQTAFLLSYYNIDDVSIIAMDITAYAGNDATICVGDSLHLGRPQEVGLECLWYTPNNSVPFASTSDIWFKPTQAGNYTFIQRMDNCAITWDTVRLIVIDPCNLEPIIPNVFTPNGDGVNDVFEFKLPTNWTLSGAEVPSLSFTVYNRWGLILTPSLSKGEGATSITQILWDGRTTSGIECSAGVYFYVLEYKDAKGDVKKKNGYISLIR